MKDLAPSAYLKICAAVALLLLGAIAVANFAIDPMQYFRRAKYRPFLHQEARYQNPGLARNYDYDTIILGTSVSLGYDTAEVSRRLNSRVLNLAMSGASAHEQFLLLQVALRSGRVKRVIWDINYEFIRGTPTWVSDYDGAFPAYFYDPNPWNEIPHYLLNLDTTKDTLKILLGRQPHVALSELAQLPLRSHGRDRVLGHWEKSRSGNIFTREPAAFAPANVRASFAANFAAPIREHPEVQFDVYFPPISFVYYTILRTDLPAAFEDHFRWKEDIQRQLAPLPNARLFDFQGVPGLVLDLARYTDAVHYDAAARAEIIDSLLTAQHLATPETLAATESLLRRECTPDWPTRH